MALGKRNGREERKEMRGEKRKRRKERYSGTKNCLNSHCRVIMSCHKVSVIYKQSTNI